MARKKPQVKCPGCELRFYREDEEFIHLKNRYWHKKCYQDSKSEVKEQANDLQKLEAYICQLFKTDFVSPRIRMQINNMKKNYKYTESGILGSLIYWFDVKENTTEKANNGIGIVPFIYEDAKEHFETIALAHQKNKGVEDIKVLTTTITIPSPKRNVKKQKVMNLDYLEEGYPINEG